MKIKRFLEKDEFDDYKYTPVGEEEEDDEDGTIIPKKEKVEDDEFDSESASAIDTLCYYVRQLFTKSGVDVTVEHEDGIIMVYVFLEKRENMFALLEPFKVVESLQSDILPQYEAEVELYENKKGNPILAFTFMLSDGEDEDEDDIDDESEDIGGDGDSDEKLPF